MKQGLQVFIIAAIASLLFVGCSSTPSPGEGKTILENKINSESEGNIKLVKFEKTDGQEGEMMGVKFYTMMFQGEIEFTADVFWMGVTLFADKDNLSENDKVFDVGKGNWLNEPNVFSGQHRKITGALFFEKTEKGWQGFLRSYSTRKIELNTIKEEKGNDSFQNFFSKFRSAINNRNKTSLKNLMSSKFDWALDGYISREEALQNIKQIIGWNEFWLAAKKAMGNKPNDCSGTVSINKHSGYCVSSSTPISLQLVFEQVGGSWYWTALPGD